MGELWRRLAMLAGRRKWRRELEQEMALHRDLRGDDRRFGNELRVRERSQEAWGWGWLDSLAQDIRHGLRLLTRMPTTTGLALLSLTLGIGANTALFSLADALMTRPLAVAQPRQLVQVVSDHVHYGFSPYFSNPFWERFRNRQDALAGVLAWSERPFSIGQNEPATQVNGIFASGSYFSVLGINAERGRLLKASDDFAGCPAVVDISDGLWHSYFDGRADVVGATLPVRGHPFQVVGVMPSAFLGVNIGARIELAVPLCDEPIASGLGPELMTARNGGWLEVMGRLRPRESLNQAVAGIVAMMPRLRAVLPADYTSAERNGFRMSLRSAAHGTSEWRNLQTQYGDALDALLGICGVLLLLACVNLMGLMLARVNARRDEIAVRLALGGSRLRLIRQLMTETMLLAVGGALLGAGFAVWACHAVERFLSFPGYPVALNLTPDGRVLGFNVGLMLATAAIIGLMPAMRATRVKIATAPKSGCAPRIGLDRWIAATQLALALVLLVGAGLFLKSFLLLVGSGKGFDSRNVLLVTAHDRGRLPTGELERLGSLPGVVAVSASEIVPAQGSSWGAAQVQTVGSNATTAPRPSLNAVAPGYFAMMRTPVLAGREFNDHDTEHSASVAIVNLSLARRLFGAANPLGRQIETTDGSGKLSASRVIVGVAGDAKYQNLRSPAPPTLYLTLAQLQSQPDTTYYLRGVIAPSALAREARAQFARDAPGARLEIETYDDLVNNSVKPEHLLEMLSEAFGGLALLLSAIGVYGLGAYRTSQRRREFGVRCALGARPYAIAWLVFREVAMTLAAGLGAGAALTWIVAGAARITLTRLLYTVRPGDWAMFVAATAALAIAVALAGAVPARRAAHSDPMLALRED